MNLKSFMTVVAGIFSLINVSRAQADANVEHLGKNLKFNSVECFRAARAEIENQPTPTEILKRNLKEKNLQPGASNELTNVMADVTKALKENPTECAIVSVTVDSSTNLIAPQHTIRWLRFEGVGDAAVQSLAPQLISNSQFGSITNQPPEGFNYDTNLSHLICFGLDAGELKAVPIPLGSVRASMMSAVQNLQEADVAPKRPAAPKRLRIQTSP